MPARRVARVLVDSPLPQLDRLFDYVIPDELAVEAVPGVRVKVPLRSAGRVVEGYLVEMGVDDPADRPLSDVDAVVSPVQVLPARLYRLARAVADRAAGGAGDILRLAVPKRMVRAEKAWLAGDAPTPCAVPADAHDRSRSVLAAYPGLDDEIRVGARIALDAAPGTTHVAPESVVGRWAVLLAAAAVTTLSTARSTIIVVPDYRDEEQVLAALASFGVADAVVRVDARQSGPERYGGYLRILAEAPCIVVGSRSAVYAPAHDVGLVAVWDDGDPLLSEPLSPGVHARDAALVRQELDGGALLFAGHTRTTDVQRLVDAGWVRELPAARRASPRVILSATREGESRGSRVPSAAFAAAREALQTGPVLVQVARPGFAPSLVESYRRRGASEELLAAVVALWEEFFQAGPPADQAEHGQRFGRFIALGAEHGRGDLGIDFAINGTGLFGPARVDDWLEIMPWIRHVHGKFFGIDENGEEPSVPVRDLVALLVENGYNGAISSEYEGWHWNDWQSAFEIVAGEQAVQRSAAVDAGSQMTTDATAARAQLTRWLSERSESKPTTTGAHA